MDVLTPGAGLYDWLLLVHVLAAMLWFGGIAVIGAFAVRVLRARSPEAIAAFLGQLRAIGPILLAPAPVLLVVFGGWMIADSDAWDAGQTWVQIAIGLFVAAFLIGAAHQSRAAIAAERAAGAGDYAEAARRLRQWAIGMGVIVALLAVATWDMVLKPGL